jgi:hypothetical protein
MKIYDCEPTLTDTQVLSFCKNGFLMMEGVVPDEINRRTCEFLEAHPQNAPREILEEDWFVDSVILNPQAAGAVRSLLGANFALPIGMANHRIQCPLPAQNWHRDGGSRYGSELNHLQVFYYPQDAPVEMGPTEVLPGSHFLFNLATWMGHYGNIRGGVRTAAPAGSIFITVYSIWHRRSASTAHSIRNMLKYAYWRTVPPRRDWIIEPDFDFGHDHSPRYRLDGPAFRQQFRDWYDVAEMFYWLCAKTDEFQAVLGGEGWPPGYPILWKPEGFHRFQTTG